MVQGQLDGLTPTCWNATSRQQLSSCPTVLSFWLNDGNSKMWSSVPVGDHFLVDVNMAFQSTSFDYNLLQYYLVGGEIANFRNTRLLLCRDASLCSPYVGDANDMLRVSQVSSRNSSILRAEYLANATITQRGRWILLAAADFELQRRDMSSSSLYSVATAVALSVGLSNSASGSGSGSAIIFPGLLTNWTSGSTYMPTPPPNMTDYIAQNKKSALPMAAIIAIVAAAICFLGCGFSLMLKRQARQQQQAQRDEDDSAASSNDLEQQEQPESTRDKSLASIPYAVLVQEDGVVYDPSAPDARASELSVQRQVSISKKAVLKALESSPQAAAEPSAPAWSRRSV